MEECKQIVNTGLRGVTVASTKISDVQGEKGKLIYRGYLIQDLAKSATFEETVYLLLYERLPKKEELESFTQDLAKRRKIPDRLIQILRTLPPDGLPMDVLQTGVSMLALYEPEIKNPSREKTYEWAKNLIARLSTLLAAWHRVRGGLEPVTPDPSLGHAENFLYMLTGKKPDAEMARFFDICLVLHAEHSFNASTFAAREIASTKAHIFSAIGGAIGSLSGDLHGGANVRVMEMLLKIGSIENVRPYINNILDEGKKIMGLGHAVYKTDDPRARIIAPMSKKMGERTGNPIWYEMSVLLEKEGKKAFKERKKSDIYANVDFYSASLYHYMGIPTDLFTPVFAISRISGWTAHVIEEQLAQAAPKPMLYRPESEYIGDYCGPDECVFVDIDHRKTSGK